MPQKGKLSAFHDRLCRTLLTIVPRHSIDLTAASVVHLIEPHWNPMVEAQAVDRVYRIGQVQEVTVIRYIVPDSVETVSVLLLYSNIQAQAADYIAQYVQIVQQEKMNIINQTNNINDVTEPQLTVEREKVRATRACLQLRYSPEIRHWKEFSHSLE